jgi:hypothetical protein
MCLLNGGDMATLGDFLTLAEMLEVTIADGEPIRDVAGDFGVAHQVIFARTNTGHTAWLGASNQALHFGGEWLRRKVEPLLDVGEERFFANMQLNSLSVSFIEWPACHPMQKLPWLLDV